MVKICTGEYTNDSSEMNQHFKEFPFELSPFQKYAIEGIATGNHSIIAAPTGSGKTLPAEFAIKYFLSKGKKVIYTSPITKKQWSTKTNNMPLIDATKNSEAPKVKDLKTLKEICKNY